MRHVPCSTFSEAAPLTAVDATRPISRRRVAWARVVWLLGLPRRMAAARRDMALLAHMSGSELADIGLTRQDLCDAVALPLGASPGPLFTRRVAERRRARLAARG